jgi:hypothetical protein
MTMVRPQNLMKRIVSAASLSIAVSASMWLTGSANHVAPTIRDTNMGNLPNSEREVNITVDPNNPDRLAAGANDRPTGGAITGQHWYTSVDGGRTWSNGALPTGTLTLDGVANPLMSDPSLDYGSNGELYYATLMHGGDTDPCTLFVVESDDQGANWTDAANGVVRAGTQTDDECNDKEHIAVDRLNNDNVYVAWTPIGGPLNREVVFSRDLGGVDNGFAFSAPTILSNAPVPAGCLNQGADFALDTLGNIYIAWTSFCSGFADGDPGTVFVVRSTNQGGSWSVPVAAATLVNVDLTALGFRTRSHPSIAVDAFTGRVYVVYASYADAPANTDPDIMIVSSPDGTGGSWSAPARVNQDVGTTEQFLAWVDVGNGRVSVAFHSRAADGTNINLQLAYANSMAPPLLFTEVQVSSAPTPPATGFLGDYTGNFTGSDDVVHPSWGDGRAGTGGATDAFTARVNFSPPTTVTLTPLNPSQEVGTNVLFTAMVRGAHGEAETFIPVTFTVTSAGAPSSTGASGVTPVSGDFTFTYTNTVAGTDTLHVFADLDEDGTEDAGEGVTTTVTWQPGPPATLDLTPGNATNTVDATHVVTALVQDQFGNAVPNITVRFSVAGANGVFGLPTSGSDATDGAGQAQFSYIGPFPGDDILTAFADFDGDGVRNPAPSAHEPQDTADKTWVLPSSTPGKVSGGGHITTTANDKATFGFNAQNNGSGLKGHVTYQDHGSPGRTVKSLTIDALVVTGTDAEIFGTATVEGGGSFVFRVDARDFGEPSVIDTFRLRLSDGYDSGVGVVKGNIQVKP